MSLFFIKNDTLKKEKHYNNLLFIHCLDNLIDNIFPLYHIQDTDLQTLTSLAINKNWFEILFASLRYMKGAVSYSSLKEMSLQEILQFINSVADISAKENKK